MEGGIMIGSIIRLSPWLAAAAAVVVALPAARAQTQQQIDVCVNRDGRSKADERIATCTLAINSGRWTGKDLAWAFMARGNGYRQRGNYDAAIADHSQAIKLNPSDPDGYYNRGIAYGSKKIYDRALADYGTAISLAVNANVAYSGGEQLSHDRIVADYYKARAGVYYDTAEYERAVSYYNEAIRLNPRSADSLYWRGKSKEKIGDTQSANADIAAARAIDPNVGN
jgi:tetratricopeptide (TPR) repeat protein